MVGAEKQEAHTRMWRAFRRKVSLPGACSLALALLFSGCSTSTTTPSQVSSQSTASVPSAEASQAYVLSQSGLTGDTTPVRDPSIARQNGHYYLFSTDIAPFTGPASLPIRCSADALQWTACGTVFDSLPAWVDQTVPGAIDLWAPDISYFAGEYHLYYTASTLLSQSSAIGFATNKTLDPSSPDYKWVDHGPVLVSHPGDDFNALDPNIFVDASQHVWLTYGSFWTGIKQQQIDPSTGLLLNPAQRFSLAARPTPADHPIEGASLVAHGGYYYLLASVGHCCAATLAASDYEEIVGRSTRPNGPFTDASGTDLLNGGGTVLFASSSSWEGAGGGSAYVDDTEAQSMIAFHALDVQHAGAAQLWVKSLLWVNDWPVVSDTQ